MLEVKELSKQYGNMPALSNISFSLPAGKVVGLLGPNGSGKTTLIKIAAGLLTPTSGQILIDQKPVGLTTKAMVSYLPDRLTLPAWMQAGETLGYYRDFFADFDYKRAEEMLKRLEVPLDRQLKALSKGMKDKLQLVLTMSRRAKLYLLDEPIGGVDPATRDYILETIVSNYEPESTVIISTHLISDVEKVLDEFLFLKNGRIVLQDSVDNVWKNQSLDALFREVFKC